MHITTGSDLSEQRPYLFQQVNYLPTHTYSTLGDNIADITSSRDSCVDSFKYLPVPLSLGSRKILASLPNMPECLHVRILACLDTYIPDYEQLHLPL